MDYATDTRKWLVRPGTAAVLATVLLLGACSGGDSNPNDAADATTPDGGEADGGETEASGGAAGIDKSVEGSTALYAQVRDLPYEEAMALIKECAQDEGTVVHYTHEDDMVPGWEEVWPTVYPEIEYQAVIASTTANFEKVLAEHRGGQHTFDVAATNAEGHKLYSDEGGVIADHGSFFAVPEFPDRAKFENFTSQNVNPAVITWNTDLVPEELWPETYEDLLHPDFPGPIGIDDSPSNPMAVLVEEWGEERLTEYLNRLFDEKDMRVIDGHGSGRNLLAAGEITAHVELFVGDVEAIIVDDGAPLEWVVADPSAASSAGIVINENAPHPCAAALLANFLTSVEGSQVVADMGTTVQNPNVDFPYPRAMEMLESPNLKVLYPGTPWAEATDRGRQIIQDVIIPHFTG